MPERAAGDVVIVPATGREIEAVLSIEQASFPAPWRRMFFESEAAADRRFNIVAKRGDVVIGYLFAMWLYDEMHVNKIAVTPSERRKGVADLLMAHCLAFARERDVRTIALEVRQSNIGAQEFYRHLDFQLSYVRPRYYPDGEAAVVMTRQL